MSRARKEAGEIRARLVATGFSLPAEKSVEKDRVWFDATPEFRNTLKNLEDLKMFARWPRWLTTPLHGPTVTESFRQCCFTNSLQLTFHSTGMVEVDVDDFNPDWGVLPASLHLGQIAAGAAVKAARKVTRWFVRDG